MAKNARVYRKDKKTLGAVAGVAADGKNLHLSGGVSLVR